MKKARDYNYKAISENQAKACGIALPVSTKHSIEICRLLRNKKLNAAKQILEDVIMLKKAVPFKRFKRDVGHKKGPVAAGRFPVKASGSILALLKSAEANAASKGLNLPDLCIVSIVANKGPGDMRYGRRRGVAAKRSHVRVILEEKTEKKQKPGRPVRPKEKKEKLNQEEKKKNINQEVKPENKND